MRLHINIRLGIVAHQLNIYTMRLRVRPSLGTVSTAAAICRHPPTSTITSPVTGSIICLADITELLLMPAEDFFFDGSFIAAMSLSMCRLARRILLRVDNTF